MKTSVISGDIVRSIVAVGLALTGTVAGLAAGPAVVADTDEPDGGYVIMDEQGNAVVPEWNGTAPAGVAASSGSYAIVGEGGVAYAPEQVGNDAAVAQPVAADVTGQLPDNQLTSGDLGVAPSFLSSDTVVCTPTGELDGPDGVETFIASLQRNYPGATFAVTGIQYVGSLIVVDWQGSIEGKVAIPGRTVIAIQNGVITEISFLNLNMVSPVEGGPSQSAVAKAPAWEDLDPNAVAERRAAMSGSCGHARRP